MKLPTRMYINAAEARFYIRTCLRERISYLCADHVNLLCEKWLMFLNETTVINANNMYFRARVVLAKHSYHWVLI
jgi:hypothetical protein